MLDLLVGVECGEELEYVEMVVFLKLFYGWGLCEVVIGVKVYDCGRVIVKVRLMVRWVVDKWYEGVDVGDG